MPTTWKLDPSHTDITFAAKHMMVTTVRGKFADVSGQITADRDDPTSARGEIEIDVASLNTGSEFRDNHLRSADFFDAENHPKARFVITAIERDDDEYKVAGDLTIRGVTRPVTLKAELLGFYTSMEGAPRVGFSAKAKLNRKDWGLNWNVALEQGGWLVGDEIKLTIDAAFEEARAGSEQDAQGLSSAA
jgi:polyisoprenoid-binding protein YceI